MLTLIAIIFLTVIVNFALMALSALLMIKFEFIKVSEVPDWLEHLLSKGKNQKTVSSRLDLEVFTYGNATYSLFNIDEILKEYVDQSLNTSKQTIRETSSSQSESALRIFGNKTLGSI